MVNVLHISPIFNRASILQHGLLPSKVKISSHLDFFQEDGICTEDGKAVYTWLDCDKNTKFIRDMVFCLTYIDPRNQLMTDRPNNEDIDYGKLVDKDMSPWDQMLFDVYLARVEVPEISYVHVQVPDSNPYNSLYRMPLEYAHNDKALYVYKEPLTSLKIIGQAEYYYDRGRNIRVLR